jgi:hypothetical protein
VFTDRQLQRLKDLGHYWDVLGGTSKHVNERYQGAEAVLHEVCHALEMGIAPNAHAPIRIGARFEDLNDRSPLLGLMHEAKVFAIQGHAVALLGWQRVVPMKKVLHQVWSSGMSGTVLPFPEFCKMYLRFRRERQSKDLGVEAHDVMVRLAKTWRRRRE